MREMDTESPVIWPAWCYTGDTTSVANGAEDTTISHLPLKSRKRRIPDRMNGVNDYLSHHTNNNNNNNNNNNTVKNERLSPGTPDTLSRSRSVTPSSASYPGTPPATESLPPTSAANHPHMSTAGLLPLTGRNYSDFMRSLAAKYNNTNPNEYFGSLTSRNGFNPSLDNRFKVHPVTPSSSVGGGGSSSSTKDDASPSPSSPSPSPKKSDYPPSSLAAAAALLNPFASSVFPPLIDMSTTQTLLAMVRTAKEAEIQGLLKSAATSGTTLPHQSQSSSLNATNNKRTHLQSMSDMCSSSPLDLSAAGTPLKRARVKTPNSGKNSDSESPRPPHHNHSSSHHHDHHDPAAVNDISTWTVDDVCNFVSSIDICAEYAQKFRDQRIDGAGLPLLTEEHLTSTIQMKLGPALKLRSMLAKKLGSCAVCLHCVHCHRASTSSPAISEHNMSASSDAVSNGPS